MTVGSLWSSLRGVLVQNFSFYDIKKVCAAAGLPVDGLGHLQQGPASKVSKGNLLDALDQIVGKLDQDRRNRFVTACIEEILQQCPDSRERLEEVMRRVGWGILDATPYPLKLTINVELSDWPEGIRRGLGQALKRYRDDDTGGALTSICGMVDDTTRSIYNENRNLGDFNGASYQEKITTAFRTLEGKYKKSLRDLGMDEDEITRMWSNHVKAMTQLGYVLGSVRRNFADVHGWVDVPRPLVQKALDIAIYILRAFMSLR